MSGYSIWYYRLPLYTSFSAFLNFTLDPIFVIIDLHQNKTMYNMPPKTYKVSMLQRNRWSVGHHGGSWLACTHVAPFMRSVKLAGYSILDIGHSNVQCPISNIRLTSHSLHFVITHWGRDKIADILQTTFSNTFCWTKMYEFRLKFHWNLILRIQSIIFQHWLR